MLIRLFETDDYVNNTIKTSWLDGLIAEHFQTEKPDVMLSIICGAIHVANETFRNNSQNSQSSLER
jgi:acetyl-CoA carboxylase/biotin carboxylase 1